MGNTSNKAALLLYALTNQNIWRDKIKQQNFNATSGNVDELFANWTFQQQLL